MPNGWTRPIRAVLVCVAPLVAIGLAIPSAQAEPEPTLAQVRQQVDSLHHRAEQAAERYNEAGERLAQVERRLVAARADASRLHQHLRDVMRDMGGFAAASYRTGGVDPAMQIFLAPDAERFLSQASLLDAYANQQIQVLHNAADQRRKLAAQQAEVTETAERRRAVHSELAAEKREVEALLAKAEKILAGLRADERASLERQQSALTGRSSRSAGKDTVSTVLPATGEAAAVIRFALAQEGEPYRWGSSGPNSWDCSGLTMMAWRQAGVSLPHSSRMQYSTGRKIAKGDLRPGDLVFFYTPISHVGIYLGNGMMVHATKPGDVVTVRPLASKGSYVGAVRPG